jgi:hypothetical protein
MMLAGLVLASGVAGSAAGAFLGIAALLQPDRWGNDYAGWGWLLVVILTAFAVYVFWHWLARATKSIF